MPLRAMLSTIGSFFRVMIPGIFFFSGDVNVGRHTPQFILVRYTINPGEVGVMSTTLANALRHHLKKYDITTVNPTTLPNKNPVLSHWINPHSPIHTWFSSVNWIVYLVGGLEHFLFSHISGIIIPIDVHIFQRGGPGPPTRYNLNIFLPFIAVFSWSFRHENPPCRLSRRHPLVSVLRKSGEKPVARRESLEEAK